MGSNPIIGTFKKAFHDWEEMRSVLTIDTGCWFALELGGAAPVENSIPGGYLSSDEPRKWDHRRTSPIFLANKVISLCKE
jgi:hypothetical protein